MPKARTDGRNVLTAHDGPELYIDARGATLEPEGRRFGARQLGVKITRYSWARRCRAAVIVGSPVRHGLSCAWVGRITGVEDGLVLVAMYLQHAHWPRRSAFTRVKPRPAGEAHDRRDLGGMVAGHPVRHEGAIRVPDQVDPSEVDVISGRDLVDEAGEVGHIIDRRALVSAAVRRVPKAAVASDRSVGRGEEHALLVNERRQLQVVGLLLAARSAAVQQDDER